MPTTTLSIAAAAITFAASVILAKIGIPILKSAKKGQKILEIGPRWQKSKEGTPTMGGLFFLIPVLFLGVVYAILFDRTFFVHLGFLAANGLIGFVEDLAKFTKMQYGGLSPRQKLILMVASAAVYAPTVAPLIVPPASAFAPG